MTKVQVLALFHGMSPEGAELVYRPVEGWVLVGSALSGGKRERSTISKWSGNTPDEVATAEAEFFTKKLVEHYFRLCDAKRALQAFWDGKKEKPEELSIYELSAYGNALKQIASEIDACEASMAILSALSFAKEQS